MKKEKNKKILTKKSMHYVVEVGDGFSFWTNIFF